MKDRFHKELAPLREKKLYLFDMDGTIYCENRLFEGVLSMLSSIKERGGRYVFITNNPTRSAKDYREKLTGMGVSGLTDENFFTSAQAAILLLKEKHASDLIYAQGTASFLAELREAGLQITTAYQEGIGAVLVAFDTELTAEKLRTTAYVLTVCDVPYYATNPDWVCPVDFGYIPDCGSMCFGLEKATGKSPFYIGKPKPTMVEVAMGRFGVSREETLVLGDRLYTDIAAGQAAGVDTALVLSGEATLEEALAAERKPTYLLDWATDIFKE